MKKNIYDNKSNCCGCTACLNVCPKNAIYMEKDEYGNLFPKIDLDKCINCNLCEKVCPLKNKTKCKNDPVCYAAYSIDEKLLLKSSSGGIFSNLAKHFLEDGGVVCGCSMDYIDDSFVVEHVLVDNLNDLWKLQGSKYVQSNISKVLVPIKKLLNNNKKVLFSGTPCQVAGLKSFLRKNYDNLYTIDIICHGAPSFSVFSDYIKNIEEKNKAVIKNIIFRDKKYGWCLCGSLEGYKFDNKKFIKFFSGNESSYYYLFQKGYLYRENCYSCPFASNNRPADITIGDFWGVEKEHPELLKNNKNGISCLIINNNNGEALLDLYGTEIYKIKTSFDKIKKHNEQLIHPTIEPKDNKKLLDLYKEFGYEAIDKEFINIIGRKNLMINKFKNIVRPIIKKIIKK